MCTCNERMSTAGGGRAPLSLCVYCTAKAWQSQSHTGKKRNKGCTTMCISYGSTLFCFAFLLAGVAVAVSSFLCRCRTTYMHRSILASRLVSSRLVSSRLVSSTVHTQHAPCNRFTRKPIKLSIHYFALSLVRLLLLLFPTSSSKTHPADPPPSSSCPCLRHPRAAAAAAPPASGSRTAGPSAPSSRPRGC